MNLPDDKGLTITTRHMRAAKLCARESRKWFAANGLDWNDFLSYGISETRLREIGEEMPLRAVAAAHKEATDGKQ